MTEYYSHSKGEKIAFNLLQGGPLTVVFFGGFMSDMEGTKAIALERFCREKKLGYLRFDYSGHGKSSGKFEDGTIGAWADQGFELIDHVTKGPLIFIGSSMGGWTSLLAALRMGKRLKGWIGIAPAPDFTERLIIPTLSAEELTSLKKTGQTFKDSDYGDEPYIISQTLLDDGRQHLLLNQPIPLDVPIRIIHGEKDIDVPAEISKEIVKAVASDDVELTLIKNGDHRLSGLHDLRRLCSILSDLVNHVSR